MSLSAEELYKVNKTLCHCDEKGNPVSINLAEVVYHLYRENVAIIKRLNELETVLCEQQVEISTPRQSMDDNARFDMVSKTLDSIMEELNRMKKEERKHISKIPVKKVKI